MEIFEQIPTWFDTNSVDETCWKACNKDSTSYEGGKTLPDYSDDKTRVSFVRVGSFFECVANCQEKFAQQRLTVILPVLGIGLSLFIACQICCCLTRCFCYKWFKQLEKRKTVFPHDPPPSYSTVTSPPDLYLIRDHGSNSGFAADNQGYVSDSSSIKINPWFNQNLDKKELGRKLALLDGQSDTRLGKY